jgi:hypothetical protein
MDLAPAAVVELIARLTGPAGQRNTVQGTEAVY